eukprot:scaffold7805_cov116-Isochrysis_galbana.AAC.8
MAPSNSCVICAVASYMSTRDLDDGSSTYGCRQKENSLRSDFHRLVIVKGLIVQPGRVGGCAPAAGERRLVGIIQEAEHLGAGDDGLVDPLRVVQPHRDELVHHTDHPLEQRRRHVRPPAGEQGGAGGGHAGDEREEGQQGLLVVLRLEQQRVGHQHEELAHGRPLGHKRRLRQLSHLQLAQQALRCAHEGAHNLAALQAQQRLIRPEQLPCIHPPHLLGKVEGKLSRCGGAGVLARGGSRAWLAGGGYAHGMHLLHFGFTCEKGAVERVRAREDGGNLLLQLPGVPALLCRIDQLSHIEHMQKRRQLVAESVRAALRQLETEQRGSRRVQQTMAIQAAAAARIGATATSAALHQLDKVPLHQC